MHDSEKYYPNNCPAYLTGVADRAMRERIANKFRETGYNISGEQLHILMFLYLEDGLTQKELSQRTGKSKVSVVKAINLLEANNLAVRIQSESDLRNKKVHLTPKGKKMESSFLDLMFENNEEIFRGLNTEEIEEYKRILKKIIDNMNG